MKKLIATFLMTCTIMLCLPFTAKAQRDTLIHQRDTLPELILDNALPQYATDSLMPDLTVNEDSLAAVYAAMTAEMWDDDYFKRFNPSPNKALWYAALFPGGGQIYNRKYWKLPIIYGGIAAFTTGAIVGKKNIRPYMVGGAVATWYLSVLDGVISYKSYQNPLPARASILASLIPGLGQAWNGDYWKIPLYYGGFAISGYCWVMNQKQYRKYKQMHIDTYESGETSRNGLSLDDMVWYRDRFRRLRDYSIICTALIYVLNIIDANVFSHLSNFDISDDLSLNVQPGVIEPVSIPGKAKMGSLQDFYSQNLGVRLNFNF